MKKLLFGLYIFIFGISTLFAQEMMWTTMSGTNIRHIPLNNIKAEVLRLSTQFNYFWLDIETPFISRARLRAGSPASALENPVYKYQTQMFLSWIDNNQNFVYATRSQIRSFNIDSMVITVVNGDRVYMLTFHTTNATGRYPSSSNRDYLDNLITGWLSGMANQHSTNPVAINTFNWRTGVITRSAPSVSSSDYDRVHVINRFNFLPSNWFANLEVRIGWNENQIRANMGNIGLTNTEQNLLVNEVKRSGSVIFYYLDRQNYINFIHVEIE